MSMAFNSCLALLQGTAPPDKRRAAALKSAGITPLLHAEVLRKALHHEPCRPSLAGQQDTVTYHNDCHRCNHYSGVELSLLWLLSPCLFVGYLRLTHAAL